MILKNFLENAKMKIKEIVEAYDHAGHVVAGLTDGTLKKVRELTEEDNIQNLLI